MEIKPITFREACEFISKHHRHHRPTVGCKFCVGLYDGTYNACSMLYGACCRIAREMGYTKIITYILESEDGASLKASNFQCEGIAGGTHWTGKRNKGQQIPNEMKTRWVRELKNQALAKMKEV